MIVGDIVRVKYTGESVSVCNIEGNIVQVKRAMQTRDGIVYRGEPFSADELETVEANIDREFQEAMYRRSLIEDAEKEATLPTVATNRVQ